MKSINPLLFFIAISCSSILFSQTKKDVYFLMSKKDNAYHISGNLDNFTSYITIYNRKEYEYHQRKREDAKSKNEYYFDPASARDNLGIHVSRLTFKVIKRKEIKINYCDLNKFKFVDYKWLTKNSWKKMANEPYNYKNIYFLYELDKENYISYKVGLTMTDH